MEMRKIVVPKKRIQGKITKYLNNGPYLEAKTDTSKRRMAGYGGGEERMKGRGARHSTSVTMT